MPEFILDHGSAQGARTFAGLDAFTQGYVEAMFFTDASDADDGDLANATFDELADEALSRIVIDCQRFQSENVQLLTRAYGVQGRHERSPYDAQRAGNDYWYTRNGHGTGFWDRGLGELGDQLAAAARYSSVDLVRGDDGKVHLM